MGAVIRFIRNAMGYGTAPHRAQTANVSKEEMPMIPKFPLHARVVGPTGRRGVVVGNKLAQYYQDCMVLWDDGGRSGWIDAKTLKHDIGLATDSSYGEKK